MVVSLKELESYLSRNGVDNVKEEWIQELILLWCEKGYKHEDLLNWILKRLEIKKKASLIPDLTKSDLSKKSKQKMEQTKPDSPVENPAAHTFKQ